MKIRPMILLLTLFIFPSIALSEEIKVSQGQPERNPYIEIEGRYWMPALSGMIKKGDGLVGSDVNIIDTLGIKEDQQFFQGKATLKFLGINRIRVSYLPLSIDGSRVITESFVFNGKTYTVDTLVKSNVDVKLFKIGYGLDFISNPMGYLGVFIDLNYADVSATISAPDRGFSGSGSVTGYLPAIGIGGRVYLIPAKLSLTGEIGGMQISSLGRYIEAEVSIDYRLIENFGISAGYRTIDIKAEKDDDKGELTLTGPYFSLFLRF